MDHVAVIPAVLLALSAAHAQPQRTAWILSSGNAGAGRTDVHSVEFTDTQAIVRSAGISLANLGPLAMPAKPKDELRKFEFRIPLRPQPSGARRAHVPPDVMGVFLNGAPIYNHFEAASYQGQNLWHYDPIPRGAPGMLEALAQDTTRHSPLIGFALDGYPVYGPVGAASDGTLRVMRSSYRVRPLKTRDRWPDGVLLAPGQYGPPVNAENPLGTFAEDYEYREGSGDLDRFNGRFAVTPEYPQGTYAYFYSAGQFPYLLASEFFGKFEPAPSPQGIITVDIPYRTLEFVHEKPLHLMIVSDDLADFDHVHPELTDAGKWQVRYDYPHGGHYRLYAQYTPPGGNTRVDTFDVNVDGPTRPAYRLKETCANARVTLTTPAILRAGEDVELTFDLKFGPGEILQPYLGAWAHVAIAGEGLSAFIHAHPMEGAAAVHTHTPESLGPPPSTVRVLTSFPHAGIYKIWVQMQVSSKVEAVPLVVRVADAAVKSHRSDITRAEGIRVRITPAGFEPPRVQIHAGKPTTLIFERSSDPNCGSKVVFPDLQISKDVPLGGEAAIVLPPRSEGELRFACGMGMYRGSVLVVEP